MVGVVRLELTGDLSVRYFLRVVADPIRRHAHKIVKEPFGLLPETLTQYRDFADRWLVLCLAGDGASERCRTDPLVDFKSHCLCQRGLRLHKTKIPPFGGFGVKFVETWLLYATPPSTHRSAAQTEQG